MATHSFEFMIGIGCLVAGLLSRLLCGFLRTRRTEALKQADAGLAADGWRGVTVLDTFQFGAAVLLCIGAALVAVSFISHARF